MNFRIVATPTGQGSEVYLDGMQLSNVTKISVGVGVGEPTKVALEFINVSVIVDGDVDDVKKTTARAGKDKA